MSRDEWAIRPADAAALPGRPSRLIARGAERLVPNAWRMIDLGNEFMPNAINDRDHVVGRRALNGDHRMRKACLWQSGQLIDLVLLGGPDSEATDINNAGEVVGWTAQYLPSRLAPNSSKITFLKPEMRDATAFMWANETAFSLATPDLNWCVAYGINDAGLIVGQGRGQMTGGMAHAILWKNREPVDLGTLGGTESCAIAVNNRGEVVGWAATKTGDRRAFLWYDGRMLDLGTLGGKNSGAKGVNSRGHVVGSAEDAVNIPRAFLWRGGRMEDLGTLCPVVAGWQPSSVAFDINDLGQVVGSSWASEGSNLQTDRAFFWSRGHMVDLGVFGRHDAGAEGINNHGRVVGWSEAEPSNPNLAYGPVHACFWDPAR